MILCVYRAYASLAPRYKTPFAPFQFQHNYTPKLIRFPHNFRGKILHKFPISHFLRTFHSNVLDFRRKFVKNFATKIIRKWSHCTQPLSRLISKMCVHQKTITLQIYGYFDGKPIKVISIIFLCFFDFVDSDAVLI